MAAMTSGENTQFSVLVGTVEIGMKAVVWMQMDRCVFDRTENQAK